MMSGKTLLALLILLISVNIAEACDCDSLVNKNESTLVFRGIVTNIRQNPETEEYEITFKVKKKIKGRIKGNQFVTAVRCLADYCCGIPFKLGEYYYVVTRLRNMRLYSDECTMTYKIKSG